jgi:protein phosphatase
MMRAIDGLNDVVIDITKFDVQTGDRFLLCSDGLSGVLSNEVISDVMSRPDLTLAVSTLIELTLSAGAPDNVTVVIGEYRAEAEEFTPFVVGSALEETQTIEEEVAPQRRRRFTWWPWALAVVIIAIGALSVSAWINKQYYLGSNGLYVTIYNGIPQHLGSMALSEPVEVSNVAMVTLTQVDRDRLADGITVGSLADGEQLVKDLYLRSSICNSDTSPCTR